MYKVNAKRLQDNLELLGKIGRTADGGICRFTYSKEYFESVEFLKRIMQDAGLEVFVDSIGNVIGTAKGKTDRIILMGSHIDSVPNAGIFDGCLGVLSAIEAMHALHENGVQLDHTVKVAAWAEEEGNTVVGLLGSGAFVGKMNDLTEVALKKMSSLGLGVENVEAAKSKDLAKIDAYLELHIEQGGILDADGVNIGVVNGIVGIRRFEFSVFGTKNHAGTTPMHLRDDALIKAANLILELDKLAREVEPDMVCTIGWIRVEPGVANVIPGKAVISIEIRAMREDSMDRVQEYILQRFKKDEFSFKTLFRQVPVLMAQSCKQAIGRAADELGLSRMNINSGAGHDTMIIAEEVGNCGMVFVPSVGGVSHCPEELTHWSDVSNGANVLLNSLLNLDQEK